MKKHSSMAATPRTSGDRTEVAIKPEIPTNSVPSSIPDFIRHSELPLDARVIALKAEEHYVRVWTAQGTDFLRYRFRDAVDDMSGQPGLQVHRSWWVRTDSVREVRKKGRGLQLELVNGLEVPVSVPVGVPEVAAAVVAGMEVDMEHAVANVDV